MRSTMMDLPLSVARILQHGAETHARSTVVTGAGPEQPARRSTFADVSGEAARLANALRRLGVDSDQRVATFMHNNVEHLTAYLAVPAAGAVLHPLNVRLAAAEVAWIANHAEDHVVLVDAALVERFAEVLPTLTTVRHVVVVGTVGDDEPTARLSRDGVTVHAWAELLADQPSTFDWPEPADERDAAALSYTSGTTGRPRGVAYSHRSIWLHSLQLMTAEAYGLSDHDRVLVVVPQFHAMAWGFPYAAFMSGCSLVLPDGRNDAESLVRMVEQERPTYAAAVPTVWQSVLELADRTGPDLSSLREAVAGGSALPETLLAGFEQRHGVRLVQGWGMTETSPRGALGRPPAYADPAEDVAYRLTQGRFPASVQARLVDDDGRVVPRDGRSVGELQVRGPWVTGRYFRDPEADAVAFDDGWLRTGDVGSMTAEGFLTLTDRAKDVIKSGGEWISSVALEHVLSGHESVREAAVVAVPDDKWGERPLAVVVRRPGVEVEASTLRRHVAASFPGWQVPDLWCFVDALPKTSTGKLDKVRLRTALAAGELTVERVDG